MGKGREGRRKEEKGREKKIFILLLHIPNFIRPSHPRLIHLHRQLKNIIREKAPRAREKAPRARAKARAKKGRRAGRRAKTRARERIVVIW